MADKENSAQNQTWRQNYSQSTLCNWQRLMFAFLLVLVFAFVTTIYAQQQPGDRTGSTNNTNTTTKTTATLPKTMTPRTNGTVDAANEQDKPANEDENSGQADQFGVGEGFTNPNLDADADRTARKRTRPERPYYFTAQYATRYDDNVVFGDTERRRDIVALPQVGFGMVRVTRRSDFRLDYLAGGEVYTRNSELSGMLNSVNLSWDYDLSRRTTVTVNDFFFSRPNPTRFSELGFGDVPLSNAAGASSNAGALNLLTNTRSTFNQFTTGLNYQTSKYSHVYALVGYAFTKFSSDQLIDSAESSLELGYNRILSRTSSFDLSYRVARFTSSGGADITAQGSSLSHSFMPIYTYQRTQRLKLRFGAGPQYVLTAGKGKFFWTALGEMTYSATRRTNLALTYNAGVGMGGGLGITRNQTVFGTVSHQRAKLQMEFRAGFSRATQVDLNNPSLLSFGGANNELVLESQIAYPIAERVAIFFDYSYARQFGPTNSISGEDALNVLNARNGVTRNTFSVGFNFDTRRNSHSRDLRTAR